MKYLIIILVIFISLTSHAQFTKSTELFTYTNKDNVESIVQFLAVPDLPSPVYYSITKATIDSTAVKLANSKSMRPNSIVITQVDQVIISTIQYNDTCRKEFGFTTDGRYLFYIDESR